MSGLCPVMRPIASLLSPGGRRGRLAILMYHHVLPAADPLRPTAHEATTFEWQMQLLGRYFNPLPLSEALRRLHEGTLPARAVAVTFDDGYADNVCSALPILRRHRIRSTFFIAVGFLDGGRMWNDTVIEAVRRMPDGEHTLTEHGLGAVTLRDDADRRRLIQRLLDGLKYLPLQQRQQAANALAAPYAGSLPENLMMTSAQVLALQRLGMEFGAHTVNHPILTRLDPASAREEIRTSKSSLERLLNDTVHLFAYPNGRADDYSVDHAAMLEELGFSHAMSTDWGAATARTNRWDIPRFTPWDKTPARFMRRLLLNYLSPH